MWLYVFLVCPLNFILGSVLQHCKYFPEILTVFPNPLWKILNKLPCFHGLFMLPCIKIYYNFTPRLPFSLWYFLPSCIFFPFFICCYLSLVFHHEKLPHTTIWKIPNNGLGIKKINSRIYFYFFMFLFKFKMLIKQKFLFTTQAAKTTMQNKIISSERDLIGIVFFGTVSISIYFSE